jgi:hypothetical protein
VRITPGAPVAAKRQRSAVRYRPSIAGIDPAADYRSGSKGGLTMAMSRRARAALVLSFLATASLLASSGAAGRARAPELPKGATDITETARGRQLIRDAQARFAARGHDAGELRAVKDSTGTLIVPRDTEFVMYPITLEDGRRVRAVAPITADDPAWVEREAAAGQVAALAAPTWQFVSNRCFSVISDTWSVLDHCYYKYKLANDGNSSYDWYALNRFGTAHNNWPWVLDLARIRAYRSGGSSQAWADWSPRGNWSGGGCSTTTIGITSPVGGLSKSFERCPEQVTFVKSANGTQPDYTQTWFGLGTRGNREVNFEIAVRVTQGGTATWAMPAEVRGSAY